MVGALWSNTPKTTMNKLLRTLVATLFLAGGFAYADNYGEDSGDDSKSKSLLAAEAAM